MLTPQNTAIVAAASAVTTGSSKRRPIWSPVA
jgi:hypothetical protein